VAARAAALIVIRRAHRTREPSSTASRATKRKCSEPSFRRSTRAFARWPLRGIQLIDLAAHTSDDDGVTWRSADLHVGDSLHYTTTVRAWIADLIVAHMRSIAGAAAAASVGQ
jgi:hypothetical protein